MPHVNWSGDFVILGAGFSGTLMATALRKLGHSVLVIDRQAHPRFAIGESSTPLAAMVLERFADRFNLPWLRPLTKYGRWREKYPELVCGRKRGFSYFWHDDGEAFSAAAPSPRHLLVAASGSDHLADTQWLRSDVDRFLAERAQGEGVEFWAPANVTAVTRDAHWEITCAEGTVARCRFLIDATGGGQGLCRLLKIPTDSSQFVTATRAVFTHLEQVADWTPVLRRAGVAVEDYPFSADDAAQHHVYRDGWVWMLRFDNGRTSVGWVWNLAERDGSGSSGGRVLRGGEGGEGGDARERWERQYRRCANLQQLLGAARLADSPGRWIETPRLQRQAAAVCGDGFAMLPNTAGFVDPLHSTGIAHALCGVEWLAERFAEDWDTPRWTARLAQYQTRVKAELRLIDRLVGACYEALANFRLFTAASMLYFAAATTCEQRRTAGAHSASSAFLLADDPAFTQLIEQLAGQLRRLNRAADAISPAAMEAFEARFREQLAPYNQVGLCDPAADNLYRYTAVD